MKLYLVATAISALALTSAVQAGPRADRKAQVLADSAKPIMVKGGQSFNVQKPIEEVFDAVVTALKKADESVALADKDAGIIATEIEIEGGWKQTGTRTVVSLIKESATVTTVKVVVTTQKRYKATQVEPWSDPVINKEKTPTATDVLKKALDGL